jgi:hypothetical protein
MRTRGLREDRAMKNALRAFILRFHLQHKAK